MRWCKKTQHIISEQRKITIKLEHLIVHHYYAVISEISQVTIIQHLEQQTKPSIKSKSYSKVIYHSYIINLQTVNRIYLHRETISALYEFVNNTK